MKFENPLLILAISIVFQEVTSKGRSKKSKSLKERNYSSHYEIYESDWLPSDVQITTYLYKDIPKTFLYWSSAENKSISAIIMTCSSAVRWKIFYHSKSNVTKPENLHTKEYNETTKDLGVIHFMSSKGLYILNAISEESNTYMHIYISTENEGPQALRSSRQNNLKILKRGKKDSLMVRWDPSLVDPQRTNYCLVINKIKHYKTMCSAELDMFNNNQPAWEFKSRLPENIDDLYPTIECVGRKTHLKISKIKQGVYYYFDLFATNKQTNLTYLLDWSYKKFDDGNKVISIKDGKFTDLKKIEGKAFFGFKVRRNSGKTLNLCIIPCGSYVYVDVKLKRQFVIPQTKVDRFKNITLSAIEVGERYVIKVVVPQEDFVNTGVEIFATTRLSLKSPIPTMPQNTTVKEYESLRTCNSVTLGWMPTLGQKSATYCFIVKEGKIKENEGYSQPNQCGLENRLKKSLEFATFALKFCKHINHKDQPVITKEIKRLKPGKSYIILVTVMNPKGRSLSYNVLQVETLSFCNNYKVKI